MSTPEPTLSELFDQNIFAKVLRTAINELAENDPPTAYPEYVPQVGPQRGRYQLRDSSFWTCGFFPGSIYALLERLTLYPGSLVIRDGNDGGPTIRHVSAELERLGAVWSEPLFRHAATRTDTHDMSFMIQPSLRRRWELFHDSHALDAVIAAARNLQSRYHPVVRAVRSWDALVQDGVKIDSMEDDFLVIVDSMCNLDLLFYAASQLGERGPAAGGRVDGCDGTGAWGDGPAMREAAIHHANTIKMTLLRKEPRTMRDVSDRASNDHMLSSCHVANISPKSGHVKEKRTAQGYSADSTWARGQAWGILGFAQTYHWTKEVDFLRTSEAMADYFIHRLETAPKLVEITSDDGKAAGRYVPLWDFDAPLEGDVPLRDSSAGVIAANGMLEIASALLGRGEHERGSRYLEYALVIVEDTLRLSLAREKAVFAGNGVKDTCEGHCFDGILKNATANHNAKDHKRYWDHGLVYGDYYLIEFGNRLLKMGLA